MKRVWWKWIALSLLTAYIAIALGDTVLALGKAPSPAEREQEEYRLKRRIQPLLTDVLKEKFLALSVNVLYVLQRDPILTKDSEIQNVSLPGFGNKATLSNKPGQITGFVERYARYRFLILMVSTPLTPVVEKSVTHLLEEKAGLELGTKDTFNVEIVADVRPKKEKPGGKGEDIQWEKQKDAPEGEEEGDAEFDEIFKEIQKNRMATQKRLARLFPDLEKQKGTIEPRMEAESSKHLILSREAYFNNDLNTALNEVIESISINPYSSKSYEMLGSIYYRLKWHNLALNNWTKALALDPDNKKLSRYIEKLRAEL